jgi:hypothetical protein
VYEIFKGLVRIKGLEPESDLAVPLIICDGLLGR